MKIKFNLIGLEFEADVNILTSKLYKDNESPVYRIEAESGIEFLSLKCDEKDAAFLCKSELSEKIIDAELAATRGTYGR